MKGLHIRAIFNPLYVKLVIISSIINDSYSSSSFECNSIELLSVAEKEGTVITDHLLSFEGGVSISCSKNDVITFDICMLASCWALKLFSTGSSTSKDHREMEEDLQVFLLDSLFHCGLTSIFLISCF